MLAWLFGGLVTLLGGGLYARHWLRTRLAAPRLPVVGTPSSHGLAGRTVEIPTARGRRLAGWLLAGDATRGTAVICHGWGVNRCYMLPLARPLQAAGWQVLVFDARNHGVSDADSFSSMPRFAEDMDAALDWVRAEANATAGPLLAAGHSVGAAATLLSASRRRDLAGVISVSAFVHPEAMMRRWLAAHRIPQRPFGWLVLRYVEWVIGYRFAAIAPVNRIAHIPCPVLLAHGAADRVIPPADAEALAAAANPATTTLVWLPGGHDLRGALDAHWPRLRQFLTQLEQDWAASPPPIGQGTG